LLNVSVDVSSCALLAFCAARGVLYLDTVVEPWAGGYCDAKLPVAARSNYAQREEMLALKAALPAAGGPTALVTHGANPGLVSHLVKQALLDIAAAAGRVMAAEPASRRDWAALASSLGVRTIHISERDSQVPAVAKQPGEFVNTWSVDGFLSEGCQPAELGWGSHERALPADAGTHASGSGAAIYLNRPGCSTKVRSWSPGEGPFHGFLITHNESISIADFLTLRGDDGGVLYRPTVHYSYHPVRRRRRCAAARGRADPFAAQCDSAVSSLHELAGKNFEAQPHKRLLGEADVVSGADELGVLLCGMPSPCPASAYWLGSQLTCDAARRAVEANTATTLQVTSTILGGVVWALENPQAGILEPEDVPGWRRILDIAAPYVLPMVGEWTHWTPLAGRGGPGALFPEQLDTSDPWQFANVRVN
jgi:homospermidine synthase